MTSAPTTATATPLASATTSNAHEGRSTTRSINAPLPRTGVVLIGTSGSVRALAGNLAQMPQPVIPTGCVLVNALPQASEGRALGVLPPILGHADELISLHAKFRFQAAVVSLPASMPAESRRIIALLAQLGVRAVPVPTFEDLLAGRASPAAARSHQSPRVDVAGLIGRTHWGVDKAAVARIIKGKRVLITGAGGSIGGELARVCAGFAPAHLALMERSENALFEIDAQMGRRFPSIAREAVLHDVTDERATHKAVLRLGPDVVFHAAAHKHVPLMEDHPSLAVTNNLFGTASIADACLRAGVERFVMISSDKAVNPTSVMGATKRLAEMYVQGLAAGSKRTRMSMVRFGNVLASACSVVPIWSQQLAEGHPLTVTDPRMTRYFMTIPEAATLVVQAAALDQPVGRAPVYVLDMGEPISILEMALRFLRQHGLEPAIDTDALPPPVAQALRDGVLSPAIAGLIRRAGAESADDAPDSATYPVVFSGARPGEKLFEELAYNAEMLTPTAHPAIGQWQSTGTLTLDDADALINTFAPLRDPASDKDKVVNAIRAAVPEMKPPAR